MRYTIINETPMRVPRAFLRRWIGWLSADLRRRGLAPQKRRSDLALVFVSRSKARRLNRDYRAHDYATDVLSFSGLALGPQGPLGELVFCPDVVCAQAKEHRLSYRHELGYLVIHGVLHLLGYDHEKGSAQARAMFKLQDALFEDLCRLHQAAKNRDRIKAATGSHDVHSN